MTKINLTNVVIFSPAENDKQAKSNGHPLAAIVTRVLEDSDTCNLQILVGENSYTRIGVKHRDDATRDEDSAYWITELEFIESVNQYVKKEAEKITADANQLMKEAADFLKASKGGDQV